MKLVFGRGFRVGKVWEEKLLRVRKMLCLLQLVLISKSFLAVWICAAYGKACW